MTYRVRNLIGNGRMLWHALVHVVLHGGTVTNRRK